MVVDWQRMWLETGFGALNPYPLESIKRGIKSGHEKLERWRGGWLEIGAFLWKELGSDFYPWWWRSRGYFLILNLLRGMLVGILKDLSVHPLVLENRSGLTSISNLGIYRVKGCGWSCQQVAQWTEGCLWEVILPPMTEGKYESFPVWIREREKKLIRGSHPEEWEEKGWSCTMVCPGVKGEIVSHQPEEIHLSTSRAL